MSTFTRLVGQVIAVEHLDQSVADFERFGFALSDRSARAEWGIDTATFGFRDGCYLELVAALDPTHPIGGTVARFLERRGEGLYMTTLEVPDVHATHDRLVAAGVGVAGPPVAAPVGRGIDCDLLWLRPSSTAGAFFQLLSYRDGRYYEKDSADGMRGLFNQAVAVADIDGAVADFERLGLTLADRSSRADWGLDTATFHLAEASSIELVAPRDRSRPAGRAVGDFIDQHGGGHYMTVFEVDDVDAIHARLVGDGVPVLGPPTPTPQESPWPPARQLWVHPAHSHGAFLEFLTLVGATA